MFDDFLILAVPLILALPGGWLIGRVAAKGPRRLLFTGWCAAPLLLSTIAEANSGCLLEAVGTGRCGGAGLVIEIALFVTPFWVGASWIGMKYAPGTRP